MGWTKEQQTDYDRQRYSNNRDGILASVKIYRNNNKEKTATRRSVLRKERIEAKLCTTCGSADLKDGRVRCSLCSERSKQKTKEWRDKKRAEGMCWDCGKQPPEQNRSRCIDCHNRNAEKNRLPHNRDRMLERGKKRNQELKHETYNHYGYICRCCNLEDISAIFLTIDHINNDGAEHRKELEGESLYRWLIRNNFPDGFQTLCWNCNEGKRINGGICPHQIKKQVVVV